MRWLAGHPPNARTDIYALGTVLHDILSRCCATSADGELAPQELEQLRRRCRAPEPTARPASAREVAEHLQSFIEGDRSLALRRERAARLAAQAETALPRALDELGLETRTSVARDALTALVLDPAQTSARRSLLELLTHPPRRLPDDVAAILETERREQTRQSSKTGLINVAVLVLLLLLGRPLFAQGGAYLRLVATVVAMGVGLLGTWLRPGQRWLFSLLVLSSSCVASVFLARGFGPLVLVPIVLLLEIIGMSSQPPSGTAVQIRRQSLVMSAAVVSTFLLLLILEFGGLWSPVGTVIGDQLILTPQLYAPGTASIALSFEITAIALQLVFASLLLYRLVEGAIHNRERVELTLWQFRQVFGDVASD